MKKRKIRCYQTIVGNSIVYYLTYDGWANFTLATCLNCGEIFVIDWENPETKGLSIIDIAGLKNCPNCNALLKNTIKKYPENIKLRDGRIGSFKPSNIIPRDEESLVGEFFELDP